MHRYWGEVFERFVEVFEAFFKKLKFWASVLLLPVGILGGAYWQNTIEPITKLWWVTLAPLVLSILYAFKRAIEEQNDAQEERVIKYGDDAIAMRATIGRLEEQLRQTQDTEDEAENRAATLQRLGRLQREGITLRDNIERTYLPNLHRPAVVHWQQKVLHFVEGEMPGHANDLRLPIPPNPARQANERDHVLGNLDEWLARLQRLIAELRRHE